ncbi:acyl transferase/acyl hydrolase/lysophospholipase [Lasiosphaeris hirsuta]|uniref:Patatin-like phospholipase domain-containing protein n=1 Tax=Lasiosphaeris hirsuta TaxID=260670 RepID=A0AA40AZ60_9PEZI|nr:acyl transferase/acyl hydrolase/lysophospholipase [Lasiosphaeris hirsuta]
MTDLFVHGPPAIRVSNTSDSKLKLSTQVSTSSFKKKQSKPQKHVTFQPLTRIIRDTGNLVLSWRDGLTESEREDKRRVEERMQILAARMENATSLEKWESAAKELDELEGNDEWKLDDSTGDYLPGLIETKLRELDTARTNCDIRTMMYLIRTALSRDLGGMGNIDLYRHSYSGTKHLIERYVDSAVKTIEALVEKSAYALPPDMESKDLLEGMLYARQSFGRSALLLSGGATFGMSHIGVLKALYESNLLPRIISGASAGSIVCAVLCTRKDEEIPDLVAGFPYGDLGVFEGENEGISDHIRRLLTEGSWADITHLTRVMRSWLGDLTFQEAYNRTRRVCNICVSSASIYELPRLLNYVTAPNVMIWSAVAASCSVPLVFQAAPLLVKDPATGAHVPWNPTPQRWIDGSVDNDLPMTRLAEMFNVNHFIVSQVNPHVVPFLSKDDRLYPGAAPGKLKQQQQAQDSGEWLYTLTTLAKEETLHRLQFLTELGVFPNLFTKLRCILSQRYSGDITILPEIAVHDLPLILKNPTSDFMIRNCLIGERATWPKLSRVNDRCSIELALDHAVHALRARVVFSKSQVDLRRLAGISDPKPVRRVLSRGASVESGVNSHHRPVCHVHHPSSGEGTLEEQGPRRRRSSGGSMQILAARHKKVFQNTDDVLTDDQSEEDERLEMASWNRSVTNRPVAAAAGKSRTKRSMAKMQSHTRSRSSVSAVTTAIAGEETKVPPSFNFSAPMSPPTNPGNDSAVAIDDSTIEENMEVSPLVLEPSQAGIKIIRSSPPMPTADRNTSDGDVDSDSDPYYHETYSYPTRREARGGSASASASVSESSDITANTADGQFLAP